MDLLWSDIIPIAVITVGIWFYDRALGIRLEASETLLRNLKVANFNIAVVKLTRQHWELRREGKIEEAISKVDEIDTLIWEFEQECLTTHQHPQNPNSQSDPLSELLNKRQKN